MASKAGMASGCFCVAGPRHFELGPEVHADQRVQGLVLDLHAVRPLYPLAQRCIRGKAFWAMEGLLETGEDLGRE